MPCVQIFQTNFFVLVISSSLIKLWFSYLHQVSAYTYSELPLPIGHAAHVRLGHMPGFSDSSALRENASCVGTCARVSQRTKKRMSIWGGGCHCNSVVVKTHQNGKLRFHPPPQKPKKNCYNLGGGIFGSKIFVFDFKQIVFSEPKKGAQSGCFESCVGV